PGGEVVRALLRGGADPNARTVEGTTPLALAARQGAPREVFEALLRGGALPFLGEEEGLTPCDEARTNPDLRHRRDILKLLCP
ncbi:MAG TPA: ankyrin repeat domain-containing protein, partial [Synergistaceae bacterium]|nr:ankyrin repeat domain-containing protein [Synergistaceae bacterium]